MKHIKYILIALILSYNAYAGPESVYLHIDLSSCAEENLNLKTECEHWDYELSDVVHCSVTTNQADKSLFARLDKDTYVEVSGQCNGHSRHCVYHFKPSKMLNVSYPSNIHTSFPNGKTLTTPLINDQLPYLKVECE